MTKWYTSSQTVGKNTNDNLMANLSKKWKLSRRYANDCIRVTLVTVLKVHGYTNADICSYTGQKKPKVWTIMLLKDGMKVLKICLKFFTVERHQDW